MNIKKCLTAIASFTILAGCTKLTPAQVALEQVSMGKIEKNASRPACEIQFAEYKLETKLMAFDITTSGGLRAGFDLLAGFLKLLSVDVKATSGRMVTGMSLRDSISPKYELANVVGSAHSVKFGAAVDLGFKNIGAGFSFSTQTPLTSLIERSLKDTFYTLYYKIYYEQEPWHTQVVSIPSSSEVIVPVGSFADLKMGDQFAVYNVNHVWADTPCESEHVMMVKTTEQPLAVGTVTQLTNNAALLTLDRSGLDNNAAIEQGARVEIYKLNGKKERLLNRVIELGAVTGAKIAYDNSQFVDVSEPLKDYVRALARTYGFMIYSRQ